MSAPKPGSIGYCEQRFAAAYTRLQQVGDAESVADHKRCVDALYIARLSYKNRAARLKEKAQRKKEAAAKKRQERLKRKEKEAAERTLRLGPVVPRPAFFARPKA